MTNLSILFIMNDKHSVGTFQEPPGAPSDEALCALAAGGDPQAETELVQRYGRLVRVCARPLFLAGGGQRGPDPGGDAGSAHRHPGL